MLHDIWAISSNFVSSETITLLLPLSGSSMSAGTTFTSSLVSLSESLLAAMKFVTTALIGWCITLVKISWEVAITWLTFYLWWTSRLPLSLNIFVQNLHTCLLSLWTHCRCCTYCSNCLNVSLPPHWPHLYSSGSVIVLVTFLLECISTLCSWRKLWLSKTQPHSRHWTVEEPVGPLPPLGFLYGRFLLWCDDCCVLAEPATMLIAQLSTFTLIAFYEIIITKTRNLSKQFWLIPPKPLIEQSCLSWWG